MWLGVCLPLKSMGLKGLTTLPPPSPSVIKQKRVHHVSVRFDYMWSLGFTCLLFSQLMSTTAGARGWATQGSGAAAESAKGVGWGEKGKKESGWDGTGRDGTREWRVRGGRGERSWKGGEENLRGGFHASHPEIKIHWEVLQCTPHGNEWELRSSGVFSLSPKQRWNASFLSSNISKYWSELPMWKSNC